MIIFGTRGKVLSNDIDSSFSCNYCDTANSVYVYKQLKYFHIFWIPMFPYSGSLITQCDHCKQVVYEKELEPENRKMLKANFSKKTPLGYFVGLLIIGAIIVFAIASSIMK